MASQLGVEHRLGERSQLEAVVGADEVDRPAHDDDPHDAAVQQQLRELVHAVEHLVGLQAQASRG